MAHCKNCGSEIQSHVKFCPKCGIADPLGTIETENESGIRSQTDVAPPTEAVQQPVHTQQYKPLDFTWFDNNFIILFVIFGAVSYILTELCGAYIMLSTGFGITLGVFAIFCVSVFLALGIIRFVISYKGSDQSKAKTRTRDIICLALAVIVFVFVLLSCIALFVAASDYNDAMDALGGLFG